MSKCSQLCGGRFRHSDFVIPSDSDIRHSGLRITVHGEHNAEPRKWKESRMSEIRIRCNVVARALSLGFRFFFAFRRSCGVSSPLAAFTLVELLAVVAII